MSDNESNESRDTVADIVADIRERAENAMRNGERLVHNEAVAMLLRSIADRIEAAAKREVVSKTETTTVGNAAAKKHRRTKKKYRRTKADDPLKILHDYWRDHYEV